MTASTKRSDGLVNFHCSKCNLDIGALAGATGVWCPKGHRMLTDKELKLREARKLKREARKLQK